MWHGHLARGVFRHGPGAGATPLIGSRSEPETRARLGRVSGWCSAVISSTPRGARSGRRDYWAGQRTTGGPVGTAPAPARAPIGSSVTWS